MVVVHSAKLRKDLYVNDFSLAHPFVGTGSLLREKPAILARIASVRQTVLMCMKITTV